jgi:hypothetical protein
VSSSLLSDPSLDLLSLARSFELLSSGDLSFATLPNNGSQTIYPDGVLTSIVGVDAAAIPSFIRAVIGETPDPGLASAPPAAPATVTLDVLNGTSTYLLATRNATQLHKLGFHTDVVDSTPSPMSVTSIEYPPGKEAAAKAVLGVVAGAKLIETTTVSRVTLELGADGKQVRGLSAATTPTAPSTTMSTPATPAPRKSVSTAGLGCID